MKMEIEGTWQRGRPRKTWLDCVKVIWRNLANLVRMVMVRIGIIGG